MPMKYFQRFLILFVVALYMVLGNDTVKAQVNPKQPVDYVNPFIGTGARHSTKRGWGHGYTYPGAVVPWGMVSVSPHTAPGTENGYIYGKPYLYGFGHVQLSGVGCSDLGNVVLMPTVGVIHTTPKTYRSKYGKQKASPGYYETVLKPSGIVAQMTATTHAGISKYTFPASDSANILIDASVTENESMMPALGHVKVVSNDEVVGWTKSGHFCGAPYQTQKVYFVAKFSQNAASDGTWIDKKVTKSKEQWGRGTGAYMRFVTHKNENIYVKVGISYVSIANARLNLKAEQPGWDFTGVRDEARALWNHYLSRIQVQGGTKTQKTIFYTALYHMLIHPSNFTDVNGDYLTMGHMGIAKAKNYTHYDVYSLWDTYRDEHDFLTLFYPNQQHDMVKSILAMYKESGWLPKWELAGSETYVMVGDPAAIVLAETYQNGIHNFNIKLAYDAMKHDATDTIHNPIRPGLKQYETRHYIPTHTKGVWGSLSTTLEYGLADYSDAIMARILDHEKDYRRFMKRTEYYKNLWDPEDGFLRPRKADGTWYTPFNPNTHKMNTTGFVEGNAWNYLFFVPEHIRGLAKLMGGDNVFINKLREAMRDYKYVLYNEPDIAFPYLFTYFKGKSWLTQKYVRAYMKENYTSGPGGLPGNDDCGVLSAWYVFSALGLYPANPISGKFRLGSPIFSKVTIHLDQNYYKGKTLVIKSLHASNKDIYVRSIKLNGQSYHKSFITHNQIENGGTIEFDMSRRH